MRLYRQTFYLYRIVSYRKTEIWKTVDWLTIILYVVLVVAGWVSICGASYNSITWGYLTRRAVPVRSDVDGIVGRVDLCALDA